MKSFFLVLLAIFFISASSIAQWKPTSGPSLGVVKSFYNHNDTIYAAMDDYSVGSIIRSTDSGVTWIWLSYPLHLEVPADAVIYDGTTLYAGTRNRLYTSSDQGSTWRLSMTNATVHSLALFKGAVYYCGLNQEFKFTTDHGMSWKNAMTSEIPNNVSFNVLFSDGDDLYLGSNGAGLFRTADLGKTWQPAAQIIPITDAYIEAIGSADSVLLVSTPGVVYRSLDHGITWNSGSVGLPDGNGAGAFGYNGNILVAGVPSFGLYRSTDLGASWKPSVSGVNFELPSPFAIVGKTIVIGSHGIFRSIDGAISWNSSTAGVAGTNITSLLSVQSAIIAGNLDADFGSLWRTTDRGMHWDTTATGLSTIGVNTLCTSDAALLCGTDGSGMFFSTNDGNSWNASNGFPENGYVFNTVTHGNIALAGANGFSQSLFLSTDGGINWVSSHEGLSTNSITSLLSDGNNFLASVMSDGFFVSKDSGKLWTPLSTPAGVEPVLLGKLGNYLFAGDGWTLLYRSSDHGMTWQLDTTGLNSRKAFVFAAAGSTIYLGTDRGVYRSLDSGISWMKDAVSEIENLQVHSLLLKNEVLYAGTLDAGVWEEAINPSSVKSPKPINNLILSLNPNPSSGKVLLSYFVDKRSAVKIEILNALGQSMLRVADDMEDQGKYDKNINVYSLPDGNYFVRLLHDGNSSVKVLEVRH